MGILEERRLIKLLVVRGLVVVRIICAIVDIS